MPSLEDNFANNYGRPPARLTTDPSLGAPQGYGLAGLLGELLFGNTQKRDQALGEQLLGQGVMDRPVKQGFPMPAPASVPGLLMDLAGTLPGKENVLLAAPAWARQGGMGKLAMLRLLAKEAQELATTKGVQGRKLAEKAEVYHATDPKGFAGILDAGEISPNPWLHQGLGKKKQAELMAGKGKTSVGKVKTPQPSNPLDIWASYDPDTGITKYFHSTSEKNKWLAENSTPNLVTVKSSSPNNMAAELQHKAELMDGLPDGPAKTKLADEMNTLYSLDQWMSEAGIGAPGSSVADAMTNPLAGVSVSRVPRIKPKAEKAITFVIDQERMPPSRPLAETGYRKSDWATRDYSPNPRFEYEDRTWNTPIPLSAAKGVLVDKSALESHYSFPPHEKVAALPEFQDWLKKKASEGFYHPNELKDLKYMTSQYVQQIPEGGRDLSMRFALEDIFARAYQAGLPVTVYESGPQMQFRRAGSLGRPADKYSFGAWEPKHNKNIIEDLQAAAGIKPKTTGDEATMGAFGVGGKKATDWTGSNAIDAKFVDPLDGIMNWTEVGGTNGVMTNNIADVIPNSDGTFAVADSMNNFGIVKDKFKTIDEAKKFADEWAQKKVGIQSEVNSKAAQWSTGHQQHSPDGFWEIAKHKSGYQIAKDPLTNKWEVWDPEGEPVQGHWGGTQMDSSAEAAQMLEDHLEIQTTYPDILGELIKADKAPASPAITSPDGWTAQNSEYGDKTLAYFTHPSVPGYKVEPNTSYNSKTNKWAHDGWNIYNYYSGWTHSTHPTIEAAKDAMLKLNKKAYNDFDSIAE